MSRVAKQPVIIPDKVEIKNNNQQLTIKGGKGELQHQVHPLVEMKQDSEDGQNVIKFNPVDASKKARAITGTTRNIVNNMVQGVHEGFEKTLEIQGVGYRAQLKGTVLHLTLGYSHPIEYNLPEGITADLPSQTEVIIKGIDKQLVGQVASEIRAFRKPDPYKNKGVRYKGERLIKKEVK